MDLSLLIPTADDFCVFCGCPILKFPDAVLVPDGLGGDAWWHMTCRDIVIPFLQFRADWEADEDLAADARA